MIQLKQNLAKKEKHEVGMLLQELTDSHRDFYITKNNLRLFIQENTDLLFDSLKKGDKIAFNEKGILFITGWSDNAPRKYIKILTEDERTADQLLKVVAWNIKCPIFAKIKKTNPLKTILEKNGFRFAGDRGKEILLRKQPFQKTIIKKERIDEQR